MPKGDPAGYLPHVKRARKRKKVKKAMPTKTQGMKDMRRKAFMGG